jgi:hypothetical protein
VEYVNNVHARRIEVYNHLLLLTAYDPSRVRARVTTT